MGYIYMAPPHDPLHAHSNIAHVCLDVDMDYMWAFKNTVCAQAGENYFKRWGTGRYFMERGPTKSMYGHAPKEE